MYNNYRRAQRGLWAFVIFKILLFAYILTCWIITIVKFFECDFKEPYKEEIIRGVSIAIAPISAVTVWMDFEETENNK